MDEIIKWTVDNWLVIAFGFMVADKIVTVTPTKWDDIILTAIKGAYKQTKKLSKGR